MSALSDAALDQQITAHMVLNTGVGCFTFCSGKGLNPWVAVVMCGARQLARATGENELESRRAAFRNLFATGGLSRSLGGKKHGD